MFRPFIASLSIQLLLGAAHAQAQGEAKAIVKKAIKAQGGEAKVAKLKVMKIKVKGKGTFPGMGETEFVIEDSWQMPARYKSVVRLKAKGQDFETVQVVNGEKGWASVNGMVQPLRKEDMAEFKEQKYAEDLERLGFLGKKGLTISLVKESTFAGKPAVGVKITSKGHREVTLYFDKAKGLLIGRKHVILEGGKEIVQEVSYGGFKAHDGLKHYTRIVVKRAGKKFVEGQVVEIKFFDKLDEKEFAQP
jgi:hypothetical protein